MGGFKEKRQSFRVKRRLNATLEADQKSFSVIAMNFSENGLFLQSRYIFKVGAPVVISLQMKPDVHLKLNCVVRSIRQGMHLPGSTSQSGIGVEVIAPPADYLAYLAGQQA